MGTLNKAVYMSPRTFQKYDDGRIILYPNETVIENYQPEATEGSDSTPEPFTGYQYEGEEPDGGYIRECEDMKSEHDVANAIVRTRYSIADELALQRHYASDPETYADEWSAYNTFADAAVAKAKEWLKQG